MCVCYSKILPFQNASGIIIENVPDERFPVISFNYFKTE